MIKTNTYFSLLKVTRVCDNLKQSAGPIIQKYQQQRLVSNLKQETGRPEIHQRTMFPFLFI